MAVGVVGWLPPALAILLAAVAASLLASALEYAWKAGRRGDAREEARLRRRQRELAAEADAIYSPEQFAAAALLRRRAAKCEREIEELHRRRREAEAAATGGWASPLAGSAAPALALWAARLAIVAAAFVAGRRHGELIVVPSAAVEPLGRIVSLSGFRLLRELDGASASATGGLVAVSPAVFAMLCCSAAAHLTSSVLPAPAAPPPLGELAAAATRLLSPS